MIDRKKYIEWMADTYMLNLPKLSLLGENSDPIEDEALREIVRRAFVSGAILNLEWPLIDEKKVEDLMSKYPQGIKKQND